MKKGTIELKNMIVKLRRYTTEDITTIYEKIGCNPEMMHYTGWNPYHSLESTEIFINGIIEGYHKGSADYSWIIESDGHAVGIIGAYDFDAQENSIEIGYSIFQDYWGKNYASEALQLVCRYLRSIEGIRCLKAWSATDNIGSKKVLEKAGFIQTEIREKAINVDGEKFDQAFYELMHTISLPGYENVNSL